MKERIEVRSGVDMMGYMDRVSSGFDIGNVLTKIFNSLTSMFGNAFLVLIYVAFLMLEEGHAKEKFNAWYNEPGKRKVALDLIVQVDSALSKYLTLKTLVSVIPGP
ncbi:MAG: hypothetical protein R2818_13830 [Flavobacteriales bacterium]